MDIGKPSFTNGSDNSGDLSLRDACLEKSPSNVDSRRKGSSEKGLKGGYKEAHKTNRRKVHFVELMDIN